MLSFSVLSLFLLLAGIREIVEVRIDPIARSVDVRTTFEHLPEAARIELPRDPEEHPSFDPLPEPLGYYEIYPNRPEHAVISGNSERLQIRLPRRFGTFGCVDEICTLAGGFYPRIAGATPEI